MGPYSYWYSVSVWLQDHISDAQSGLDSQSGSYSHSDSDSDSGLDSHLDSDSDSGSFSLTSGLYSDSDLDSGDSHQILI